MILRALSSRRASTPTCAITQPLSSGSAASRRRRSCCGADAPCFFSEHAQALVAAPLLPDAYQIIILSVDCLVRSGSCPQLVHNNVLFRFVFTRTVNCPRVPYVPPRKTIRCDSCSSGTRRLPAWQVSCVTSCTTGPHAGVHVCFRRSDQSVLTRAVSVSKMRRHYSTKIHRMLRKFFALVVARSSLSERTLHRHSHA